MKKIAFLSDILFAFFISFILTLTLFRYLRLGIILALFLSLVCGGLTAGAVASILRVRRKRLYLKKSDETQKHKLLLHLALLSDEAKTERLTELLSTAEEPVKRFGRLRIFNKTEFYFLKFSLTPLSPDEIPNLARLKTGKKKILVCTQIEDAALALCRRLNIEVKTGDWVYEIFKRREALPEAYLGDENASEKPKRRIKGWFSRNNAKRFLVSGALILLLSRLTPFYFYYLFFGVLLLLVAVFVRIFGYSEVG